MYSSYYGGKGKYKIDQWDFQIAENSLSLFFFPSVQFICSVVSYYLWSHWLQHSRLPCPSPIPGACSNSCPSSQKCYSAILCIPGIQQELILSHYLVNTQWGKSLSHVWLFATTWTAALQASLSITNLSFKPLKNQIIPMRNITTHYPTMKKLYTVFCNVSKFALPFHNCMSCYA